MGLSRLNINVGKSGLGRRPPNQDKISGILFYSALPTGFASDNRVIKVFSLEEAEDLGITEALFPIHYYHISEYFRIQPQGELWIGIYAVPGGYTFVEIESMVIAAGGEIRQLAVYAGLLAYTSSQATTIQDVINAIDGDAYKQFSVLYAANMAAVTPVTGWPTIGDLRTLSARKVTVVAAQDGGGVGAELYVSQSQSITALGAALGAVSRAKVNESIGSPENFDMSNGLELEIPALANGDLVTDLTLTSLGNIKDDGYLVLRKYTPDKAGTYFERAPTAISADNDYAWVETNRMVDKCVRGVRGKLIPKLNGTLYLKDGKLSADTIGSFQDLGQEVLDQMFADGEISEGLCTVDPTQDVLATSELKVTIQIVPTGVAETITVNIGLVPQLVAA